MNRASLGRDVANIAHSRCRSNTRYATSRLVTPLAWARDSRCVELSTIADAHFIERLFSFLYSYY